ncbi:MAG: nitronate monooxygenase [Chitinophagaceae bacterium]|nr:MAG: nitronate monooxygenase [Chitinophagaceae bacterium]
MNRITSLFNIDYPIIQAGMIWASGWKLASAVSNAGGLGMIGAGSMYPDTLREHIQKCKAATSKPFAVNVPLLYPDLDKHIQIIIEVIAAGGIATGRQMLATMVLGAEGVQIGTRFVASEEASSHLSFKKAVINSKEGDTQLVMKKLTPVRLLKNGFYQEVQEAEARGANEIELKRILGRARAKLGMYEGNMDEGELEIGQVSALVKDILPAGLIVKNIWQEFSDALVSPLLSKG